MDINAAKHPFLGSMKGKPLKRFQKQEQNSVHDF